MHNSEQTQEPSGPELLSCPFCGGEAQLSDLGGWEILCCCGASLCLAGPEKEPLIAHWNLRTPNKERAVTDNTPMDAWVAYAKRSGLLDENGVATDRAKAQTAWFAFTAAWNLAAAIPITSKEQEKDQ